MPRFRHDSGRIIETDDHAQANRYRQSHRFEEILDPDPPRVSGTIAEILAWVGDDPERAEYALWSERQSENPRKTLIDKLS